MCEDEFYYVEDMHLCWSQPVYVHNTCGFCGGRTNVTVDIQLRECVQCQALQHSQECGHSVTTAMLYIISLDMESVSVTFTTDSSHNHTNELTGLPVGGIHSISLVALTDLPSPVVGPVTPGEHKTSYVGFTTLCIFSC